MAALLLQLDGPGDGVLRHRAAGAAVVAGGRRQLETGPGPSGDHGPQQRMLQLAWHPPGLLGGVPLAVRVQHQGVAGQRGARAGGGRSETGIDPLRKAEDGHRERRKGVGAGPAAIGVEQL